MNNIQKLISELEVRSKSHSENSEKSNSLVEGCLLDGKKSECDFVIQKLKLLLSDKHTGAITEPAHFANTKLGECAASEKTSVNSTLAAGSSETGSVGQNEQTKKVCPQCRINDVSDGLIICESCFYEETK